MNKSIKVRNGKTVQPGEEVYVLNNVGKLRIGKAVDSPEPGFVNVDYDGFIRKRAKADVATLKHELIERQTAMRVKRSVGLTARYERDKFFKSGAD